MYLVKYFLSDQGYINLWYSLFPQRTTCKSVILLGLNFIEHDIVRASGVSKVTTDSPI